ncbi:transporter substrate-binding domain-containing protein [Spongiactinospora rosea]|uniref:transporter substrate-binding domain-containing protein n=1 Tax=Spongiactinospora rosea TaxID=2248750 RepID=UPI0013141BA7|nr:transporter substrate-binding domain-containing protein [Spongiactinospora rosea]
MGAPESFPRKLAGAREPKITIESLVEQTGLLSQTIKQLTSGTDLLSWEVTSVFLDACGKDPAAWRHEWELAAAARKWQIWRRKHTPLGSFPNPSTARTFPELRKRMEDLRAMVGLTYQTLEQRAADQRRRLPHATLNAAMNGRGRLERELVEAFAAACGLPPAESRRWRLAWQAIAETNHRPHPDPESPLHNTPASGDPPSGVGRSTAGDEPGDGHTPAPAGPEAGDSPPHVPGGRTPVPGRDGAEGHGGPLWNHGPFGARALFPGLGSGPAAGDSSSEPYARPGGTPGDEPPSEGPPAATVPMFPAPWGRPDPAGPVPPAGDADPPPTGPTTAPRPQPDQKSRPWAEQWPLGSAAPATGEKPGADQNTGPPEPPDPGVSRSARHRRGGHGRKLALVAGAAAIFIVGTGTGWLVAARSPAPALTLSGPPYGITAGHPLTIDLPLTEPRDWALDLRLRLGYTRQQELQSCSYHAWLTYRLISDGRTLAEGSSRTGLKEVAVNQLHLGQVTTAKLVVTLQWTPPVRRPGAAPRCDLTLDPSHSVLRDASAPPTPIPRPPPSKADRGNGPLAGKQWLKIAVKIDQPGIGVMVDSNPDNRQGIDIDIGKEIAKRLGADPEWHDVTSSSREALLQRGQADLVIASYSINEPRRDVITFAGPYLIAQQDVMVRADDPDTADVKNIDDMKDKKFCGVTGSQSTQRVINRFPAGWDTTEHMVRQHGYGACVQMLRDGEVDAVSTDNSILAGYAAAGKGRFRLLGESLSVEEYGIGLAKNNVADAQRINRILREMIRDGTWEKIIRTHLGQSAERFIRTVPPIP